MDYTQLFSVMAPVLICMAVGAAWARAGLPFDTDAVGQLVLKVGAPCLVVATISTTRLDKATFFHMGLAALTLGVVFAIASGAIITLLGLKIRTYFTSFVFGNFGNLGLPMSFFAFGEKGLALSLAFFMVFSVAHFSLGVVLMSQGSLVGQLLRAPILYAVLFAVILVWVGWELPFWAVNSVALVGDFTIPMMLLAMGVSLTRLRVADLGEALKLTIVRILVVNAACLLVIWMINIEGVMRGVLLLQANMPVAIFNYIFALNYDRSPVKIASFVVVSTAVSILLLPFLLWLIM